MGRKKDDDIVLSWLGGSADDVTGSCIGVSYLKNNGERGYLLLELGAIQGNKSVLEEYNDNKKMLENIPVEYAEYIFICHSHFDHIGNLGAAIPKGFDGRIISNYENYEICKKMLPDAAHIHKKNIEYLRSKGRIVKPLYSEQDVYAALDLFAIYAVGEMHQLNENVSFRFRYNNHIIGATQLELFIKKPSSKVKKIVLTSDLGSKYNMDFNPFVKDTEYIETANLFICESTYGAASKGTFNKKDAVRERKEFKEIISQYIKNENRVFIPAFSLARTQTLMCLIYELFKDEEYFNDIPVIIDSNLSNEINNVYSRILEDEEREYWNRVINWKNFKFIKDYPSSIAFLSKRVPSVCLSASGMVTAGRSLLYAKSFLGCSKDCIVFCGYCGENTVGGKILNENINTVEVDGSVCLKRCEIKRFYTFSSHAQSTDIIDYLKCVNADKIILQHGSEASKRELQTLVKEEFSKIDKSTKIVCTDKNYQIKL